jgi:hypothetical protein
MHGTLEQKENIRENEGNLSEVWSLVDNISIVDYQLQQICHTNVRLYNREVYVGGRNIWNSIIHCLLSFPVNLKLL